MGHRDRGQSLKNQTPNPDKIIPKSQALNPKHKEILIFEFWDLDSSRA